MDTTAFEPCPIRPNCVSSDAVDPEHRIDPLRPSGDIVAAWRVVAEAAAGLPRCIQVAATPSYRRFECRSRIFRFVDDLELELRPEEGSIAVRSASRLGYSDRGVNRARVESLRSALQTGRTLR